MNQESARAAAKDRVIALIEKHPELGREVDLGALVSRHRKRAADSSSKFWETDWDAILVAVENRLRKLGG